MLRYITPQRLACLGHMERVPLRMDGKMLGVGREEDQVKVGAKLWRGFEHACDQIVGRCVR